MGCRTLPAMVGASGESAWQARAHSDVAGAVEHHRAMSLGNCWTWGDLARRVGSGCISATSSIGMSMSIGKKTRSIQFNMKKELCFLANWVNDIRD